MKIDFEVAPKHLDPLQESFLLVIVSPHLLQKKTCAADQQAPMGVGTTRSGERLLAALGLLQEAPVQFEVVDDVPLGGVLCALPALLAFGLLRYTRSSFSLPAGFYPIETIFLLCTFLALGRVRSLGAMRYQAPGEWGKLLGMDRMPEVKALREKLKREDDGRALVRQILQSAVALRPDPTTKTLTVRIHRLTTAAHDEVLAHLCAELTATETNYPGPDLRLIFQMVSSP